ncbi:hypothetical protein BH09MYX1_BH09MYX1_01940 [soil metagenome]
MKRILGPIVCAVLVFTAVGCSGTSPGTEQDGTSSSSQAFSISGRSVVLREIAIGDDSANGLLQSAVSSYQTSPNGAFGTWGGLLGHDLHKLTVDRNADNRLQLYAIGGDGIVYSRFQTTVGGGWNPDLWGSLGGTNVQRLVSSMSGDGRLEIFALFGDGHVFHRFQVAPNAGWNTDGWLPLGTQTFRDVAATSAQGSRELVGLGADGHTYYATEASPHAWGAWTQFGFSPPNLAHLELGSPTPGGWGNPTIAVAIDTTGAVYQSYIGATLQWTSWTSLPLPGGAKQIAIEATNGNRLNVFAVGNDGHAYIQGYAPIGFWDSSWTTLDGTDLQQLAVARQCDNRIVLLARGGNGRSFTRTLNANVSTSPWWVDIGGTNQHQSDVVLIAQPF